jgi:AcrR family transcriptional regulator
VTSEFIVMPFYRTLCYNYVTTFYRCQVSRESGWYGKMVTMSTTAGRRSRTPSSDIRRELVEAAEAVLVRDGPAGVTVRAVAAQAGIAPMGVYNRLGGKDGLINALLVRGFDRLRAAMDAGHETDALDRLRACGRRYREFALGGPHMYAVMFEGVIPHDFSAPEVAEHADAAFDALVRNVEIAAAAGGIEAAAPREVAQQIWSTVHGAVALELQGLILTESAEATYLALLDTILRGLRPA